MSMPCSAAANAEESAERMVAAARNDPRTYVVCGKERIAPRSLGTPV